MNRDPGDMKTYEFTYRQRGNPKAPVKSGTIEGRGRLLAMNALKYDTRMNGMKLLTFSRRRPL